MPKVLAAVLVALLSRGAIASDGLYFDVRDHGYFTSMRVRDEETLRRHFERYVAQLDRANPGTAHILVFGRPVTYIVSISGGNAFLRPGDVLVERYLDRIEVFSDNTVPAVAGKVSLNADLELRPSWMNSAEIDGFRWSFSRKEDGRYWAAKPEEKTAVECERLEDCARDVAAQAREMIAAARSVLDARRRP